MTDQPNTTEPAHLFAKESAEKIREIVDDEADEDRELVLRIDSGLMAWLQAFVAGPGFFGSVEDTAVYLLRTALLDMLKEDIWFVGTAPHLPSPIREANMMSPKYQTLAREADRAGR